MVWTLTMAVSRARRSMKSTSATSSITGSVFGMTIMVVTPPAAAALLASASVSRCSAPGSPVKTRQSMRPGARTRPRQSTASAPSGRPSLKRVGPRSAMRPFSTRRPPCWSKPLAGSIRRALMKAVRLMSGLRRVPARSAGCARARRARPCGRRRPFPPARG